MRRMRMTEKLTVEEARAQGLLPRLRTSAPRRKDPALVRAEAKERLIRELLDAGHQLRIEHRFHPIRRWRFDLALLDVQVALEIDGGGWIHGRHHRERGRLNDEEKRLAAEDLGWRVLRVSWKHVRNGEALALVRRVAEERGCG